MANNGGVVNTSTSTMVNTLTGHVNANLCMWRHLFSTCELLGFSKVTPGYGSVSLQYLPHRALRIGLHWVESNLESNRMNDSISNRISNRIGMPDWRVVSMNQSKQRHWFPITYLFIMNIFIMNYDETSKTPCVRRQTSEHAQYSDKALKIYPQSSLGPSALARNIMGLWSSLPIIRQWNSRLSTLNGLWVINLKRFYP